MKETNKKVWYTPEMEELTSEEISYVKEKRKKYLYFEGEMKEGDSIVIRNRLFCLCKKPNGSHGCEYCGLRNLCVPKGSIFSDICKNKNGDIDLIYEFEKASINYDVNPDPELNKKIAVTNIGEKLIHKNVVYLAVNSSDPFLFWPCDSCALFSDNICSGNRFSMDCHPIGIPPCCYDIDEYYADRRDTIHFVKESDINNE